jgi:hypothetical protein
MMDLSPPSAIQPASPGLMKVAVGLFSVFGGPLAWFVQLCGGFALATQPCVVAGVHAAEPATRLQWTGSAMSVLMGVSLLAALASFALARRSFERTQTGLRRTEGNPEDTARGRSRFLALWGMQLAGVFALGIAMTAVGFWMLPRCAG